MNRRQEKEVIKQARLEIIFENLGRLSIGEIDDLTSSAELEIIGEGSVEQAKRYLFQHPAIGRIGEYERFSADDMSGRDLHLDFYEGFYSVRTVDVQIKSGIRGVKEFRDKVRDYLERHGGATPTEKHIDKHLARKKLLVLNPRSGYIKFMASFEEQMERICKFAVPE